MRFELRRNCFNYSLSSFQLISGSGQTLQRFLFIRQNKTLTICWLVQILCTLKQVSLCFISYSDLVSMVLEITLKFAVHVRKISIYVKVFFTVIWNTRILIVKQRLIKFFVSRSLPLKTLVVLMMVVLGWNASNSFLWSCFGRVWNFDFFWQTLYVHLYEEWFPIT